MKRCFIIMIFTLISISVFSADVDADELKTVTPGSVEFYNYTGPHDYIDSKQSIINIGVNMGKAVKQGASSGSYRDVYLSKHFPLGDDSGRIGADILILTDRAAVDHIRNLRYIIAGYIMTVYDYSFEQAFLLAEFVTIYNAVYRGNMEKFSERYTAQVNGALTPGKAGLATRFTEWAGKTQIVIPLTGKASDGTTGSLNTKDLTDDEVIDELRDQDDMGVDSRKDMVELKDEELQDKEKDLLDEKQDLQDEKDDLQKEQDDLDKEKDDLEKEQDQLDQEQKEIDDKPDGAEKDQDQKELDDKQKELDDKEKDISDQQQDIDQKQEDTDSKEKEVEEKEKELDDERSDLQDEREQIAEDEETVIAGGTSAKDPEYVVFMLVDEDSANKSGQLVLIDKESGTIDKTSGITDLKNRVFEVIGSSVVCISGSGDSAKLVLFDITTLSVTKESEITVYENSTIEYVNSYIYAVVKEGSSWYIGRFDSSLNLKSVSDVTVDPYTPIVVSNGQIFAQRTDGQIRILTEENF